MTILFVLYCLFVVLGFVKKDSKLVTILILTLAWVLVGWNNNGPDFDNYIWRYEQNESWSGVLWGGDTEWGFSFLCYLGNQFNLSFIGFKAILAGISYLLIYSFLTKLPHNRALVASCYMLSFFMLDVVQIRNFIAMSVMIFGFRYLLEPGRNINNIIKYVVCALIAASIHISLLFSLVFVVTKLNLKWWYIIPVVALVFVYKNYVYGELSTQMETDKLDLYRGQSSRIGGYLSSLVFLVNAAFIYFSMWIQNKRERLNHNTFPSWLEVVYFNIVLLILIPFLLDSASYSRLLKDILIVNYALLALQLRKSELYLLYLYALFFLLYFVLGNSLLPQIFDAAFINNSLL